MDYIIATDSTCDIPKAMLCEMQVRSIDMTYTVDDASYGNDENNHMEFHAFYDAMRAGARTGTSMINKEAVREFLTSLLSTGKDVLYLSFASALSGTYDNFKSVADELNADNPNKVHVVDSKCASGGEGLFVTLVAEKCKNGLTFAQACDFAETIRDNVIHYFVVEDLKYLARGGRLSKGSAFLGNILNIKPVLHVDEIGRLVPIKKVLGRKKSLSMLVDKMEEKYNKNSGTVYITHGDCYDDAQFVAEAVADKFGVQPKILPLSYVIGSHSGPGTVALFFTGDSRTEK